MKVANFVNRFTVNPNVDIKPHFKLISEKEFDINGDFKCLNCESTTLNFLHTIIYSRVFHCRSCGCLSVIENIEGNFKGRCYSEFSEEDIKKEREKEYNEFLETNKDKLIKLESLNHLEFGTTIYNYDFGNYIVTYLNKEISEFIIERQEYDPTYYDDIMDNHNCDLFDGKWFITKEELITNEYGR